MKLILVTVSDIDIDIEIDIGHVLLWSKVLQSNERHYKINGKIKCWISTYIIAKQKGKALNDKSTAG